MTELICDAEIKPRSLRCADSARRRAPEKTVRCSRDDTKSQGERQRAKAKSKSKEQKQRVKAKSKGKDAKKDAKQRRKANIKSKNESACSWFLFFGFIFVFVCLVGTGAVVACGFVDLHGGGYGSVQRFGARGDRDADAMVGAAVQSLWQARA